MAPSGTDVRHVRRRTPVYVVAVAGKSSGGGDVVRRPRCAVHRQVRPRAAWRQRRRTAVIRFDGAS